MLTLPSSSLSSSQFYWASMCGELRQQGVQTSVALAVNQRPSRYKQTLPSFTLVFCSRASPLQAFARRKSPLRIAILFPNCMSFSGPSEDCNSSKFTIPRCTRRAVWISSVISAKLLWLKHKGKTCLSIKNTNLSLMSDFSFQQQNIL